MTVHGKPMSIGCDLKTNLGGNCGERKGRHCYMLKRVLVLCGCFLFACSTFAGKLEKANWFFVNYTAYKHKIHITINGEKLVVLDKGSGISSKPSPLKEGKNVVLVRFEQKPEKIGKPGLASKARIFLSPNMMVGNKNSINSGCFLQMLPISS